MMEYNGTMMMVGMGAVWILTIAVLVLGIAALIEYLRTNPRLTSAQGRRRGETAGEYSHAAGSGVSWR